jgi:hypothetical protein
VLNAQEQLDRDDDDQDEGNDSERQDPSRCAGSSLMIGSGAPVVAEVAAGCCAPVGHVRLLLRLGVRKIVIETECRCQISASL